MRTPASGCAVAEEGEDESGEEEGAVLIQRLSCTPLHNGPMRLSHALGGPRAAWLLALLLSACSPALDWREVRPEDSGVTVMFPCKPTSDSRMVTLAGARVRMVLTACTAGGVTWALAHADMADPARVTPALRSFREATAGNLAGKPSVLAPMAVSGMTPNALAERVRVQGRLPDGEAVTLEGGFFAKGTRVYQATVMGRSVDAEALAVFFENLKLPS